MKPVVTSNPVVLRAFLRAGYVLVRGSKAGVATLAPPKSDRPSRPARAAK